MHGDFTPICLGAAGGGCYDTSETSGGLPSIPPQLKLLLYWPLFGLLFWFAERGVEVDEYHIMYCALDE